MVHARRQIVIGGLLCAGGLGVSARALCDTGSIARQFAARLSAHDIESFGALFADNYVNHQISAAAPPSQKLTPKEATVAFFKARLTGMPDLKVDIETLVASEDKVAASFIDTGTHQGVYFGVPPTGKSLRFTSCDIFRVQSGKIAEHWGIGDIASVLAQLKA